MATTEAACDATPTLVHREDQLPFQPLTITSASSICHRIQDDKGDKVHIDHLREMFVSMEMKLVDVWENKVLAGIKIRVCYENIVDDTSNHDVGYCFLSDRRNACFADRDRFLKAIIVIKRSLTGSLSYVKDSWYGNRGALQMWLRDYAEFQKDLALTRPFAEVAAYICYPDKPSIKDLESVEKIGFPLGVNSWRHISTAFKRKLEALQAGHSRATENRIYGLSPDALASGAEDLLPLFLQASNNWQL
ncbi:hypothetical protein DFJ58DRAFT_736345 [Suillus subalutaceus]|uniref:uncharacterized protein n=1 Tax=Suillus subalutaceus TaxID=48586 RepID=UPI001B871346|nr:uncharacterized protein DFJ58DRAFT_736345 [Suillus subalutaceus]KAG1832560.1 hypothetical protein DFJ58DRAFT_736345 [Suillus subalutaceus]